MAQRLVSVLEQAKRIGGIDRPDFSRFCDILSRAIDSALAAQQTLPFSPQELVTLLKQIFLKRNDRTVRPAILALMVSFKSAFHAGWFVLTEGAGELLSMTNDLLDTGNKIRSNSCPDVSSDFGAAENYVNELLARLYPWLKLEKILLSGDLEAGYKTVVCDFYLPYQSREVRLFTFRKDRMDSSACLLPPTSVNFLVNGLGIEKRTCITMDNGAQPPANCTMLVKAGINLLQIVGDFQAAYIVIVGIAKQVQLKPGEPSLPEAQPLDSHVDDELMEGPSKVSLSCPISRTRMKIPVRGKACKHHQCFDFKNYLEINQKRPSWRCPHCNLHIPWVDLRLDKRMAELLRLDENVMDVVLAKDGSWEPAPSADTVTSASKKNVQNPVFIDLSQVRDEEPAQQREFNDNSSTPVACAVNYITTELEDVKPDVNRAAPTNPATSMPALPGLVPTASLPNLDQFYQQQQQRLPLRMATQNVDLRQRVITQLQPQQVQLPVLQQAQRQQASQQQPSASQQEVPSPAQRQQSIPQPQHHAHQRQFSFPTQSQLQRSEFTVSQNQPQQVTQYHLSAHHAPRQTPLSGTTQQHLSVSRAFLASQIQSQQNVSAARSFSTPQQQHISGPRTLSSPQSRVQQQQQHVQQHLSALSSPQAQAQAQQQQLPSFRTQFSRSLSSAHAQVQQMSAIPQAQLSRSLSSAQAHVQQLSAVPQAQLSRSLSSPQSQARSLPSPTASGPQQHSRLPSPPAVQAQIQQNLLQVPRAHHHQLNQQLHALRQHQQQQLMEMSANNSWDATTPQTPPQYDPRFWQTAAAFMSNGVAAAAPPRPTGQGPPSDSAFDM